MRPSQTRTPASAETPSPPPRPATTRARPWRAASRVPGAAARPKAQDTRHGGQALSCGRASAAESGDGQPTATGGDRRRQAPAGERCTAPHRTAPRQQHRDEAGRWPLAAGRPCGRVSTLLPRRRPLRRHRRAASRSGPCGRRRRP
jgi:hypothetical protein